MATYTTTFLTTATSHAVATATATIVVALPAPSDYHVNFDDPARKGDVTGYWVFAIGIVIAFLFLLMRLYTKLFISGSFVIDDACIVLSFILGMGCQSLLVYMWQNEIQGVHAWEIPLEHYNLYNLLIMCASVLYAPTQGFAKLSLLLFYRRLAPFQWFQIAIYIVMFVVVAYTLGIMFSLIFPCKPIASNWDITISGECINKTGIYIATAVINIATDLALLILPIPILARLQIPRLEKAALIAMFAVGSMTCITSVVRLILLLPMLTDLDQTWAVSIPCVWILVEANLVVICGCLPIIRKFARHVAPRLFSDPASSGGGGGGGASDRANGKPAFDFQTIGSKRSRPLAGGSAGRKGRKGRMDYSNIELESRWTASAAAGNDEGGLGAGEEEGGRGSSSGGGPPRTAWSDGGSETCIVETKTTVVEYGESTESIRRGFARPRGV